MVDRRIASYVVTVREYDDDPSDDLPPERFQVHNHSPVVPLLPSCTLSCAHSLALALALSHTRAPSHTLAIAHTCCVVCTHCCATRTLCYPTTGGGF
jgi:hypothetical protein